MNAANHSELSRRRRADAESAADVPANEPVPVPAIVAGAFAKLNLERRAYLLGRLLGSVGPLALVVVGGGVFGKYRRNARWPEVPISFEDVARATSDQVYDLVRYVEQSNPHLIEDLLAALSQDSTTIAALGASIAAITIKHFPDCRIATPRRP